MKFVKLVKGRQAAAFDVPEEFTNEIEFRMAEINSNFILEKKEGKKSIHRGP